ncbi:MAG: TlpA disulfide reductase family protein [Balneolaceae bacterium]|nr:TlpA disulfide reductase family protein [Balneolaceae bacterium]
MKFSILLISVVFVLASYSYSSYSSIELEELPDFQIPLFNSDKKLTDEDLRGNYILIDIWSTYCGSCLEAIPKLKTINKSFAQENFEIVSIAYNSDLELKKFFEKGNKMPWTHAVAATDSTRERIAKLFNVHYTPSYYFVSPKGKILANQKDFEKEGSLKGIIEKYL